MPKLEIASRDITHPEARLFHRILRALAVKRPVMLWAAETREQRLKFTHEHMRRAGLLLLVSATM